MTRPRRRRWSAENEREGINRFIKNKGTKKPAFYSEFFVVELLSPFLAGSNEIKDSGNDEQEKNKGKDITSDSAQESKSG